MDHVSGPITDVSRVSEVSTFYNYTLLNG